MNPATDRTNVTDTGYSFGGKDYVKETRYDANNTPYSVDILKGSAPTVVSNYNTQKKVGDITSKFNENVGTSIPSFPTGQKTAVYAPTDPTSGETGAFLGYAANDTERQHLINSANTADTTSTGAPFAAPQDAQIQPNGTYLYQGQYYTKDQLASPENLAAISNTTQQQKKYDQALQSELDAINKRYDIYKRQQEQVTASGAAGAQNALLQTGAGGRGSVAQYAAVTADERVKTIMADGERALQDLDSKRDQLLSAAKIAYQDKDYELLSKLNTQITKNRDDMLAVSRKANEELATTTAQAKKDTAIANAFEEVGNDPIKILNSLKEKGITNITAKDVSDAVGKFINQKGIDEIAQEIAKAGNDPSVIKGAKTVAEAIQLAGPSLKSASNEVIKVGDNAYLIDKNTGKIIKSFGVPTGGAGSGRSSGVAETIIASGKFTTQQAAAIRNAINNGEDPETVIKNNAKSIMTATLATDLDKKETALDQLQVIDGLLKQYYAAGGKSGIFNGNYEKALNKVGSINDPKLVEVASKIALAMQSYRLAVTGTAASVQEDARIDAIFPGITDGQLLNNTKTKSLINSFERDIDTAYERTIGKTAYSKLKAEEEKLAEPLAKGSLDSKTFIDKAVANQTIPYDKIINSTPKGSIPVVDNKSGAIGYVPITEYDETLYTKL